MPWRPLSSKKRITVMKNSVPMAKEKADTAYAIAVAAQGEWNRMQGLKFARPTRILEEHQGAEVGRYYLCRSRDVGCKLTLDKTERKCILNTTYGSFREYLKGGER